MIFGIVALFLFVTGVCALVFAHNHYRHGSTLLGAAEEMAVINNEKLERSEKALKLAADNRKAAVAAEEEARRIEDSLVHPRFVVNKMGGFRALATREDRLDDETYCEEPNRFCGECFGRGWVGRDHDNGSVVHCKCIKVRRG